MLRVFLSGLLALTAAAGVSPAPPTLAGTYEFQLCRGSCSADSAIYHRGILVLSDTAWTKVRAIGWSGLAANGCFAFESGPGRSDSYAGIMERAAFHWGPVADTDGISFELYRSPDAGYWATVHPTPNGLQGVGNSRGAGVAEIHAPADSIRASRIGPADPSRCRKR